MPVRTRSEVATGAGWAATIDDDRMQSHVAEGKRASACSGLNFRVCRLPPAERPLRHVVHEDPVRLTVRQGIPLTLQVSLVPVIVAST